MSGFSQAEPLAPLGEDVEAQPNSREGDLTAAPKALWGAPDGKVCRAHHGTHSALGAGVSWFKANMTWVAAIPSLGLSTDRPKAMEPGSLPCQSPAGCLW